MNPDTMNHSELNMPLIRTFATGATRDTNDNKLDYWRFLSWPVIERYAQYMHTHRVQADGSLRDGDNWKKGIPIECYRESLMRHHVDMELACERGTRLEVMELLCAMLFNTFGLLHELLKVTRNKVDSE